MVNKLLNNKQNDITVVKGNSIIINTSVPTLNYLNNDVKPYKSLTYLESFHIKFHTFLNHLYAFHINHQTN